MNAIRNPLLFSLPLLTAFTFSVPSHAEDNPPESGLSLSLDFQLPPESSALPERPKPQDSPLPVDRQPAEDQSSPAGYQLGQGWHRGNFYFSGYANILVDAPLGEPAELAIDDLSLFVSGHLDRWVNPFTEIEISDHVVIQQGGGARGNGYAVVERLYNDSTFTEHDALRVGKMLAPVGNWNLIHAAPLVPTNTRPLTTFLGFSQYASGVSWIHDSETGSTVDWQLYWQPGSELPRRPKDIVPRQFREVVGGHVNMPLGLMDKVGASVQHGKMIETGEAFTLFGINANKSFGSLRVQSEAISSRWSGTALRAHNEETGIFGLVDYAFASRWHGILEWERYQNHELSLPSRNVLVGVSYKPSPLVFKVEYVRQMGDSSFISSGWQASLSTLF